MKYRYGFIVALLLLLFGTGGAQEDGTAPAQNGAQAGLVLQSDVLKPDPEGQNYRALRLDGIFYETAEGRTILPNEFLYDDYVSGEGLKTQSKMADGRMVIRRVRASKRDDAQAHR